MSRRRTRQQRSTRMLLAVSAFVALGHIPNARADDSRGDQARDTGLVLLGSPAVQKELKLTPAEMAQLKAKRQQARQSMQAGGDSGTSLQAKYRAMVSAAIDSTLSPAQQTRLRQLELQREAMAVISRPDIATALQMTAAQRSAAAAIVSRATAERRSAEADIDFRRASPAQQAVYASRLRAVKQREDTALLALLTADQKRRWSALIGAPFAF